MPESKEIKSLHKWAAVIGSLAVIGGAAVAVGSKWFVTTEVFAAHEAESGASHQEILGAIQRLEKKVDDGDEREDRRWVVRCAFEAKGNGEKFDMCRRQ